MGCRKSCFENIFVTDNLNVTVNMWYVDMWQEMFT